MAILGKWNTDNFNFSHGIAYKNMKSKNVNPKHPRVNIYARYKFRESSY